MKAADMYIMIFLDKSLQVEENELHSTQNQRVPMIHL